MPALIFGGMLLVVVCLAFPIECPYCHNSNANVKEHCVKRQRDGYCSEDYYDTHFNKSTCPWCRGRGRMARMSAWMD